MRTRALKTLLVPGFATLIALLLLTVGGCRSGDASPGAGPPVEYPSAAAEIAAYRAKGLPMMLDFGRGWCKPCKAMAPDLEALHVELAGKVLVRFNDLGKETELASQHKIRIMPTQVYLDREGKEVYRHEGYASKADMLAKLTELRFLP